MLTYGLSDFVLFFSLHLNLNKTLLFTSISFHVLEQIWFEDDSCSVCTTRHL